MMMFKLVPLCIGVSLVGVITDHSVTAIVAVLSAVAASVWFMARTVWNMSNDRADFRMQVHDLSRDIKALVERMEKLEKKLDAEA